MFWAFLPCMVSAELHLPPASFSVPVLCECLGAQSARQDMRDFQAASKAPLTSSAYQLLPGKHGERMQDDLDAWWVGGENVPPTHSQKQSPGGSPSPSAQDCVASNSVRKVYSVLEGGLFRDPCYGCGHCLSFFPCESGISF